MARSSNIERRLKELDKLKQKGVVNDEEYASRRVAIMNDTSEPDHAKRGGPLKWGFFGCLGIIGAIVGVIVVIVSVSAGGSSGDGGKDVHVALAKGSSGVIVPEGGRTHLKVTVLDTADGAKSDNQFEQPPAGKKYIAFDMEVENVGQHEANWTSWKLRDSKDQEHDDNIVSGVGQPFDSLFNLTPGGKTQGWVVFTVDSDATAKWLRADPDPIGSGDLYFDATQ